MSLAYNNYLDEHIANVGKAYAWIKEHLPEVTEPISSEEEWNILKLHDESKYYLEEYDAYDEYFYGGKKTDVIKKAFNYAWLHHIHSNGHHWQHWLLVNDEAEEGVIAMEMPYCEIVHMVCDWWSFSWKTGNLYEIFEWYDAHKKTMKLGDDTRKTVMDILVRIESKLDEMEEGDDE